MRHILTNVMKKVDLKPKYHPDSLFKRFLVIAGVLFIIQVGFAIFGSPRAVSNWMKCSGFEKVDSPKHIIILGGSGIPSTTTLIRSYYGAQCALNHPEARCIVALPVKGAPEDGSVGRMKNELVLRGVDASMIDMEYHGLNTHEQAENIAKLIGKQGLNEPIIIVTSPYHMRRAYLCFKKAGFNVAGCLPANSTGSEADYKKAAVAWSGMPNPIGFIGKLRYGLWGNMTAQVWMSRELLGLTIYKLRGWI